MSYSRNICSRATLYARRFNPSSCSYISHHRDDTSNPNTRNDNPGYQKIDDYFTKRSFLGSYVGKFTIPRNGVGGLRYMSSTSDKDEFLSDFSEVISDVPVNKVASQVSEVAILNASQVSEVAIAAADSAFPVAALQHVIDGVHSFTGLNWAASIALTTLMIRGATVPFLINQLKSTYKLSMMRPRLEEIKEEINAKGDDPEAMQEGQQKMQALFREQGVTPFTPLKGMLIQGPIFISFFLAITNMAEKVPSFKNGGALWFTDLTTPDAMYIFPILTAVSFLLTVEFNMQEGLEGNPIAGTMKKFSRGFAVLTVPFTMGFPKAIFCYWVTSNVFSFIYGSVLKVPSVKKALGIPDMPPPPPTKTKPGEFGLLDSIKKAAAARTSTALSDPTPTPTPNSTPTPTPTPTGQTKPVVDSKTSSSAVLSQRLKSLERQVKQRKRTNKR